MGLAWNYSQQKYVTTTHEIEFTSSYFWTDKFLSASRLSRKIPLPLPSCFYHSILCLPTKVSMKFVAPRNLCRASMASTGRILKSTTEFCWREPNKFYVDSAQRPRGRGCQFSKTPQNYTNVMLGGGTRRWQHKHDSKKLIWFNSKRPKPARCCTRTNKCASICLHFSFNHLPIPVAFHPHACSEFVCTTRRRPSVICATSDKDNCQEFPQQDKGRRDESASYSLPP